MIPSSTRVADDEWLELQDLWTSLDCWNSDGSLKLRRGAKLSETDVSLKLIGPWIGLLRWHPSEWHCEVHAEISAGTKDHETFADFVFAPERPEKCQQGDVWLIIEAKKPGKNIEKASRQARSYADHFRAPLYAVIDGVSIHVWQRHLVDPDEKFIEVEVSELARSRVELENWLLRNQTVELHRRLTEEAASTLEQAYEAYLSASPASEQRIAAGRELLRHISSFEEARKATLAHPKDSAGERMAFRKMLEYVTTPGEAHEAYNSAERDSNRAAILQKWEELSATRLEAASTLDEARTVYKNSVRDSEVGWAAIRKMLEYAATLEEVREVCQEVSFQSEEGIAAIRKMAQFYQT